nr:MAG TPA: hypothetical protein [Caudoviricetes sp.]
MEPHLWKFIFNKYLFKNPGYVVRPIRLTIPGHTKM